MQWTKRTIRTTMWTTNGFAITETTDPEEPYRLDSPEPWTAPDFFPTLESAKAIAALRNDVLLLREDNARLRNDLDQLREADAFEHAARTQEPAA